MEPYFLKSSSISAQLTEEKRKQSVNTHLALGVHLVILTLGFILVANGPLSLCPGGLASLCICEQNWEFSFSLYFMHPNLYKTVLEKFWP